VKCARCGVSQHARVIRLHRRRCDKNGRLFLSGCLKRRKDSSGRLTGIPRGCGYDRVFLALPCEGFSVMLREERADVFEIRERGIGPDYFEAHSDAQDSNLRSASSWALVRPAATSSRPRLIAAIIRSSSVISSKEELSGSRWIASITACLSVIQRMLSLTPAPSKPELQNMFSLVESPIIERIERPSACQPTDRPVGKLNLSMSDYA
jgi:hypothetical protein